ncbi:MAG: molecular chaperone SurA [Pseudomonadales bacterium]|nr:molecular chaperone SurA [Pseudomonadales bacterium]
MRLWLLMILLGMLTVAKASTPLDGIAVVVDDDVILNSEIQDRMNDVIFHMQQNNTPVPTEDVLREQVTNQLILDSLQLQMAKRAGIKIDDDTLNHAMTDLATQNHLSLDAFRDKLNHTPGTSYDSVREEVGHEIMIERLRNHELSSRVRITDQDVSAFLASPEGKAALATEYHLAQILVSLPDKASPEQIDAAKTHANEIFEKLKAGGNFAQISAADSQAENALDGGDLGWRSEAQLPTLFASSIPGLKVGDVLPPIRTDTGFHIIKLLDKRSADNHFVHQIACEHILIKPSEVLSDAEAHEKIMRIYDRLLKGADFSQQAQLYSEDPGSARNGGSLGWVTHGEMVPEFDKVMDETPVGKISPPFRSKFGWHILNVTGVRDEAMSTQYQENVARRALYQRQYDDELQSWLREIKAEAYIDIKHHD